MKLVPFSIKNDIDLKILVSNIVQRNQIFTLLYINASMFSDMCLTPGEIKEMP